MRKYYEILGISRTASLSEIKSTYRKLAVQWHPDKHAATDKAKATEKFREITEAYEVLNDTKKRELYDRSLDGEEIKINGDQEEASMPWMEPEISVDEARAKAVYEEIAQIAVGIADIISELQKQKMKLGVDLANTAEKGEWQKVMDLIKQQADLNQLSSSGYSALYYAVNYTSNRSISLMVVDNLLNAGANPNIRDCTETVPIHYAVINNDYDKCRLLVNKRAGLHYQCGPFRMTPLHGAIRYSNDVRIAMLLIHNCTEYLPPDTAFWKKIRSYNISDYYGNTPLHWAMLNRRVDIAIELINSGVNINTKNSNGETAMDLALLLGLSPLIKILQERAATAKHEENKKCLIM